MATKWSCEQIVREILRRESASLPLTPGGHGGVGSPLYQAASRIFGSWRNAVVAAGIAPGRAHAKVQWPPERILAAIRSLARRRGRLRPAALRQRNGYLVQAARRCFGSWHKAVAAA